MWRDVRKIWRELRLVLRESGAPGGAYRPDLHYMRGRGPKWHAKYDALDAQTARDGASVAPTLGSAAGHRA